MTHKWYGPYDNPIIATINCMVGEGIDNIEFEQFRLPLLCKMPVLDTCDIHNFLDDLLQEIAGDTEVVVKFEDGTWWAAFDGEIK